MGSEETKFGKYFLVRRIASGGMAEIYLARQEGMAGFAREVVIKRIHAHLGNDPEFVNMFLDEARLVARLSHPNIVSVHEFGQEEGAHYLAMEFVDGYPVSAAIKRSRGIEPTHALRIASEMAAGLNYAHSLTDESGGRLGIVHRDISPQNVLLSFDGSVKLIDFGIAKAENQSHKTRAGSLKGKYSYMSPEQARGRDVDQRTDIHAAGIVLWEMLTGRSLFYRESMFDTMEAVMSLRPRSVRLRRPELHPNIDAIIDKALAKDPDKRYQTASDLQMAIDEFCAAQGLHSSSLGLGRYVRKLFHDSKPPSAGPSAPTPSGARSAPSPSGASNLLTPSGAYSMPTPSGDHFVPTPSGAHSMPTPSGVRTLPPPIPRQTTPTGQRRPPPPAAASGQPGRNVTVGPRPQRDPAVTPPGGVELPISLPSMTPSGGSILPSVSSLPASAPLPSSGEWESIAETIQMESAPRVTPSPGLAPATSTPSASQSLPPPVRGADLSGLWWLVAGVAVVGLLGVGLVFALGTEPAPRPVVDVPVRGPRISSPHTKAVDDVGPRPLSPSLGVNGELVVDSGVASELHEPDGAPPSMGMLSAYLTVYSSPPGAVLWLDGRQTGERTVVRDFPIDPGDHVIELDLNGHNRWRKTVTIEPGATEAIRAQLQSDPAAKAATEPDDEQPIDPVNYGLLTLDTTPPSKVFLGGRRLGSTPLESVEVPSGQYQITLMIAGGRRFKRSIVIRTGRTTRHNFDLLAIAEGDEAGE
jgi:serine/threonine-protein kinase